jgi:hypothetical protein
MNDLQYNCPRNVCVNRPEEPFEVALWQYIVTTLAVVLGKKFLSFREGYLRQPVSKCCSDDNYVHHVGGNAPQASVETLQGSLRVLR